MERRREEKGSSRAILSPRATRKIAIETCAFIAVETGGLIALEACGLIAKKNVI